MWPLAQSVFVMAGGAVAPPLIAGLFGHDREFDPVSAFVVVTGAILLRPVLLCLVLEKRQ